MTFQDLYELTFRLTKGRHREFELRYQNAILPFSNETINTEIVPGVTVLVVPFDTSSAQSAKTMINDMCLVKVYDSDESIEPVCSYWESSKTTKTLASAIFRYYRQQFFDSPYSAVESPFMVWHNLRSVGDGQHRGGAEAHWKAMSSFFDPQNATGTLATESMLDPADRRMEDFVDATDQPLVLKLSLGNQPINTRASRRKNLSRLDVLKQMFDAFVNRLLAYNFQTHMGLVTFSTTTSVKQNITHAVENFRHQLDNMHADGDTAIWDSIALASDQLQQHTQKYPKAKLRIICISDGEDNKSQRLVHDLASQLVQSKIVVDSFCLGGTFLLYVDMGEDYPMFPLKARFVTSIYHPNINHHGRICHSILDRNWTVDTTTKDVIDTIYSLLLVPEFSDPINTVVTLNYHWGEVQFKEEAQRHIQQHATKTRAEWRAEIVA
ncbi:hypothetical protein N0V94_004283 [Neodidymelliopsis sp. IMI 364377]|nr:hypothetical protein N0V94_004283 [Neodidymelliopsis sp. IMI 364377]